MEKVIPRAFCKGFKEGRESRRELLRKSYNMLLHFEAKGEVPITDPELFNIQKLREDIGRDLTDV